MMKTTARPTPKSIITIVICCFSIITQAQSDTLKGNTEEVVITATKTERKLSNVAVPTTIISKKNIIQAGSLRLKDILQEQTGLFLTSGFGTGVQMQGLASDYTLIMVDGEPLVGRTAGVLDLNRVTVGNIKKVEIVKGPSSSLYGSEAMAGVINIITDKPLVNKLDASVRYGTYNTLNANVGGTFHAGKLAINGFADSYNTDGYSIRPYSVERTVAPLWRLTNQWQFSYPLTAKTKITLGARYAYEHIKNEIAVTNNGNITYSQGREINKDLNISPAITHIFNSKVKTALRMYGTSWITSQKLSTTGPAAYDDYLHHQFYRAENQTDWNLKENLSFNVGAGYAVETVNSNRYDDVDSRKKNNIAYAFLQNEWKPLEALTIITGLRYDNNKLYKSAFSPKIAAQYKVNDRLRFNASFGRGFKAPDFRQLYLNFTNTAAGGYSVFGSLEAQAQVKKLVAAGAILPSDIQPEYYQLTDLKPEQSNGFNAGWTYVPTKQLQWKLNFFRNDIENLIDTRIIAYRTGGSQIYSYLNIKSAYTQGVETELQYQPYKNITVAGGYQFLQTADKDQVAKLKAGNYYYVRDAGNNTRALERSEYFGLPNRSKHMANLKLGYETTKQFFANLRAVYRSKWAVNDKNGNGILDDGDEFAKGNVLINISGGKSFVNGLRVQAGVDNLFGYEDVINLPNLPGRTVYAMLAYSFVQKKGTQHRAY